MELFHQIAYMVMGAGLAMSVVSASVMRCLTAVVQQVCKPAKSVVVSGQPIDEAIRDEILGVVDGTSRTVALQFTRALSGLCMFVAFTGLVCFIGAFVALIFIH